MRSARNHPIYFLIILRKEKLLKFKPKNGRFLIKKKTTGDLRKGSAIVLTETANDTDNEYAEVVSVPESITGNDDYLVEHQTEIKDAFGIAIRKGIVGALSDLIEFNTILEKIALKVGDLVIVSQYSGTCMMDKDTLERLWLIDFNNIHCDGVENG